MLIVSAITLTDGLDRVFVENYKRDQFIFAQYFGSTSGLLRYFPAYYWGGNNEVITNIADSHCKSYHFKL